MKYIIEIEDEPFGRNDDPNIPHGMDELYKAKGFNALVFDKHGLDKLTPFDKELEEAYLQGKHDAEQDLARAAYKEAYHKGYDEAKLIYQNPNAESDYQRGLDDAWECAKKLFSEMSNTEINLVFPQEWNNGGFKALMALHPQDAIDRINAFERNQEHDEIKVGDEVMYTSPSGLIDNVVGYFFGDSSDGCYKVLRYVDGKFKTGIWNKENCKRTGKHSDAVVQLLAEMRERQKSCSNCKHEFKLRCEWPCEDCLCHDRWEPKEGAE